MRFAFLTDIHLDCLNEFQLEEFVDKCKDPSIDYYLISGDIGQAPNVEFYLKLLQHTQLMKKQ